MMGNHVEQVAKAKTHFLEPKASLTLSFSFSSIAESPSFIAQGRLDTPLLLRFRTKEQTVKKKIISKKFLFVPEMDKIMAMLSGSALIGESSKAGSSERRHRERSVTLSEESVGEGEDEISEANAKFIGFGYLKKNLASKLKAEEGWFALYELYLLLGMRFSLPELAFMFLHYYGIMIGQLMPNTWRVLYGILALGVGISVVPASTCQVGSSMIAYFNLEIVTEVLHVGTRDTKGMTAVKTAHGSWRQPRLHTSEVDNSSHCNTVCCGWSYGCRETRESAALQQFFRLY
ncbi:hypothetical protein TIFTF001_027422 [Ficus carica]|uniref:Uncharacterized protein n=1 Tax=Ficus carica TaxID=3494 RepID=A0AA88DMY0_FICCA|nr:hypothetical protein TIFTF001_027422 [Ficus carica]